MLEFKEKVEKREWMVLISFLFGIVILYFIKNDVF